MHIYIYIYTYIYIYIYIHTTGYLRPPFLWDRLNSSLRYKISVFSDPDPGKS